MWFLCRGHVYVEAIFSEFTLFWHAYFLQNGMRFWSDCKSSALECDNCWYSCIFSPEVLLRLQYIYIQFSGLYT